MARQLVISVSCAVIAVASAACPADAADDAARAPILPDRSDVRGLVVRVERTEMGGLVAVPLTKYQGTLERRIPLLPSPVAADARRAVDASGAPVWFTLSGIVTAYRGENFILATYATKLDQAPKEVARATAIPPGGSAPLDMPRARVQHTADAPSSAGGAAPDAAPVAPEQAAATAEERLDAAFGEGEAAPETVARQLEQAMEAKVGDAPRSAAMPPAVGTPPQTIVRALQRSRCTFERDAHSGAWYALLFDGDVGGQRRLELLPCQALERLEEAARLAPVGSPMLLSGAAYEADGRAWVLPERTESLRAGRGVKP